MEEKTASGQQRQSLLGSGAKRFIFISFPEESRTYYNAWEFR